MSNILPESYIISFQFLQVKATLIIVIFAGSLSNIHLRDCQRHSQSLAHFFDGDDEKKKVKYSSLFNIIIYFDKTILIIMYYFTERRIDQSVSLLIQLYYYSLLSYY